MSLFFVSNISSFDFKVQSVKVFNFPPEDAFDFGARQNISWNVLVELFSSSRVSSDAETGQVPITLNTSVWLYDKKIRLAKVSVSDLINSIYSLDVLNKKIGAGGATLLEKALLNQLDANIVIALLNKGAVWWDTCSVIKELFSNIGIFRVAITPEGEHKIGLHKKLTLRMEDLIFGIQQYASIHNKSSFESAIRFLQKTGGKVYKGERAYQLEQTLESIAYHYEAKQRAARANALPEVSWNDTDWAFWFAKYCE